MVKAKNKQRKGRAPACPASNAGSTFVESRCSGDRGRRPKNGKHVTTADRSS
jgi:hypothetical protein